MENQVRSTEIGPLVILDAESDDRAAFGEYYAVYRQAVHHFLVSRDGVHTHDELEELVQDVFLRAWRGRHSFRRDSSVKTYLFGIAKNVLREERRAARRQPSVTLNEAHDVPAFADSSGDLVNAIDIPQLVAEIKLVVTRLSPRQQVAIQLVVIEDHTLVEAARLASTSASAMQHRLTAALNRLRRLLAVSA